MAKEIKLENLTEKIPYRWRLSHKSKDGRKGVFLAYIDARDAVKLLDKVVGAENWSDEYYEVVGTIYCKVSIKVGDHWVSKSDTGVWGKILTTEKSDEKTKRTEAKLKDKTIASDAFKRACVKWGVGSFLYDLDEEWIPVDKYGNPLDGKGKEIKLKVLPEYIEKTKGKYREATPDGLSDTKPATTTTKRVDETKDLPMKDVQRKKFFAIWGEIKEYMEKLNPQLAAKDYENKRKETLVAVCGVESTTELTDRMADKLIAVLEKKLEAMKQEVEEVKTVTPTEEVVEGEIVEEETKETETETDPKKAYVKMCQGCEKNELNTYDIEACDKDREHYRDDVCFICRESMDETREKLEKTFEVKKEDDK